MNWEVITKTYFKIRWKANNETKYLWFLRKTVGGSVAPSSPSQAYINFGIRVLLSRYMYVPANCL